MKIGTAITELSQLLQRVDATEWSTAELSSALHRHVLSLSRDMTELDSGYFNHNIRVYESDARQVKQNTWEYTLPHWIERVVDVRELTDTANPTLGQRGRVIGPALKHQGRGWRWNGPNTFQLLDWPQALDLEISVAKRPARPTLGVLPTQANLPASPASSYMRLDSDTSANASDHPHETLQDSYVNALIEITGNTARSGQLRRCVGSTHFVDEGGSRYTVLQVEPAWTVQPQSGDTYEMHIEIADEHMNLVLLMAANTCWGTRGNRTEQRALSAQIALELSKFQSHITPRQIQFPLYLRHTIQSAPNGPALSEDTRWPLWT